MQCEIQCICKYSFFIFLTAVVVLNVIRKTWFIYDREVFEFISIATEDFIGIRYDTIYNFYTRILLYHCFHYALFNKSQQFWS